MGSWDSAHNSSGEGGGDCCPAEEGHSPGLGTRQLSRVLIMFRCTGDNVSKDHGKIRIFSDVHIPPDKLAITGCYRPSKLSSHDIVPERVRLCQLCLHGPDPFSPMFQDSKGLRPTVHT